MKHDRDQERYLREAAEYIIGVIKRADISSQMDVPRLMAEFTQVLSPEDVDLAASMLTPEEFARGVLRDTMKRRVRAGSLH